MVLCVVFGCSKRSGRDKDVSFYRIPKVITNKGEDMEKLSRKRRAGVLSATKRADLTEKIMANDRICSRHFLSGKPASLVDDNSPDWLPTLNLGHSKQVSESRAIAAVERWERVKARESLNTECDVKKEIENDTGGANVGVDISTQTDLTTNMIEDMSHNSECYEQKRIELVEEGMQPFTEKAFTVNGKEYVKFYTGLPNFEVLQLMDRPSSLLPRACMWSNYKHHNTVKILPHKVLFHLYQKHGGEGGQGK